MMGHKEKLKTGDEYDLVGWRKRGYIRKKSGYWRKVKNAIIKRIRREGKKECRNGIEGKES